MLARSGQVLNIEQVTIYKLCTSGTVEEQMNGRLHKKLYLAAKVTEPLKEIHSAGESTDSPTHDDESDLGSSKLLLLLRGGTRAMSRPELDVDAMTSWSFETLISNCQDKAESGRNNSGVVDEDFESRWLAEAEQVRTRFFDGKNFTKAKDRTDSVMVTHLSRESRRVGKNTTVMIDGIAVSKESLACSDWEAVPTMAGKNASLANPKRAKKESIKHQQSCQICWETGNLIACNLCPRAYHSDCLHPTKKPRVNQFGSFFCPQHYCKKCKLGTSDAGGMLYRCRWCEMAYCDDCLDSSNVELLGDTLKEFLLLDFGYIVQAHFVTCPSCVYRHRNLPKDRKFCHDMASKFDAEYASVVECAEVNTRHRSTLSNYAMPQKRKMEAEDSDKETNIPTKRFQPDVKM